jgi:uncharacterized protein (DUF427 family)
MTPRRIEPGLGQESVWDYPRPPRLEPVAKRLRVVVAGHIVAETTRGHRVLETSHPPVYYFPLADVDAGSLRAVAGTTGCEWKGTARYFDVVVGDVIRRRAAWAYPKPTAGMEPIRDAVAFYAALADECTVDGQVVTPQPGGFYGGWITAEIVGPFKGGMGSSGW